MILLIRVHLCRCALIISALFISIFSFAQQPAIAVEWGEMNANPELGFNARIRAQHQLPYCEQPEISADRFDWNNHELLSQVSALNPSLLRFPGGTPANFWIWEDEVREVLNENGELDLVTFCEGSVIPRVHSTGIGCDGLLEEVRAESLAEAYISGSVTLASYRAAMDSFRSQGLACNEIFVISLIDPLYYVGSPSLESATAGLSISQKKAFMRSNAIDRVEAVLDKILMEYCGGCASFDMPFSFELGNELHLDRYGKYIPQDECFSNTDICEDCLTDVDMYADICEDVIPLIRSRFPNAEVAVNGSRNVGGEPWNQVIVDRFSSGAIQADAAMVHFYPRTSNPDSLSLDLCLGNESSIDVDKVLRYQQIYTNYLFNKRNLNVFEDTDIDLWFTEFSPYDFSESCNSQFGVGFGTSDHTYDSGNWLHALNIMNLFNSFSHYASSDVDPWMPNNHGLNINKMCMHRLFENPREAAIDEDLDYTAAGIAIGALMERVASSDSIGLLMLAAPDRIHIDDFGSWEATDESNAPGFLYDLEYSDRNGERLTEKTWDLFGWKFSSSAEESAIIVNVSGQGYDLDFVNLSGFRENTYFKTYKVPRNKLTWTLNDGEESAGLNIQEGITDEYSMVLPPFSITVLKGSFEFEPPSNNGCGTAQGLTASLWGEDTWSDWRYSGARGVRASCVDASQVDDIWFKFTPSSRDEVIQVRDLENRLDLVVEVYESCSESSIGCFDNYGLGEIENAFVNDLTIGAEYSFRVYAKSADILDIDFIQAQVKTLSTGSLETDNCDNLSYDLDGVISAQWGELLYPEDAGIDAYRFKFTPQSPGAEILYKNETALPHELNLGNVPGLEVGRNYGVQVQHRISASLNGDIDRLWSEYGGTCIIGIENNCTAFETAPVGLTKSMEPVAGVIDRVQLKWYKGLPSVPFSIADSAACDIEFWPVKDLLDNSPIENGMHTMLNLKRKEGQEFFKWPIKFNRSDIAPNISYKWKLRCACEYGNGPMTPWSSEKFFNTPDFDTNTSVFTPTGGLVNDGEGDGKSANVLKYSGNSLSIKWGERGLEQHSEVSLYDINGRRIPVSDYSYQNGVLHLGLGTSLRTGIYFMRILSMSGQEQFRFSIL